MIPSKQQHLHHSQSTAQLSWFLSWFTNTSPVCFFFFFFFFFLLLVLYHLLQAPTHTPTDLTMSITVSIWSSSLLPDLQQLTTNQKQKNLTTLAKTIPQPKKKALSQKKTQTQTFQMATKLMSFFLPPKTHTLCAQPPPPPPPPPPWSLGTHSLTGVLQVLSTHQSTSAATKAKPWSSSKQKQSFKNSYF
jgi:hypothetical protein